MKRKIMLYSLFSIIILLTSMLGYSFIEQPSITPAPTPTPTSTPNYDYLFQEDLSSGYMDRIQEILDRAKNGEISWNTASEMIRQVMDISSKHEIPPWEWESPPTTTVERGSGEETASYIVFRDSGSPVNYYAKNASTGEIEFSGTNASAVFENVFTSAGEKKVFVKAGEYDLGSSGIILPRVANLEGEFGVTDGTTFWGTYFLYNGSDWAIKTNNYASGNKGQVYLSGFAIKLHTTWSWSGGLLLDYMDGGRVEYVSVYANGSPEDDSAGIKIHEIGGNRITLDRCQVTGLDYGFLITADWVTLRDCVSYSSNVGFYIGNNNSDTTRPIQTIMLGTLAYLPDEYGYHIYYADKFTLINPAHEDQGGNDNTAFWIQRGVGDTTTRGTIISPSFHGTAPQTKYTFDMPRTQLTLLGENDLGFSYLGDFYWGTENRTDVLANPEQTASYILFTDGTNFYVKNGTTGAVDSSSTSASTEWQYTVDNVPPGGEIFVKEGLYPFGSTGVTKASSTASDLYFSIVGEGQPVNYGGIGTQRGVTVTYSGSDYPFNFTWTGAGDEGGWINIEKIAVQTGGSASGCMILNHTDGGQLRNIVCTAYSVVAGSNGINIIGTSNGQWYLESIESTKFATAFELNAQHITGVNLHAFDSNNGFHATTSSAHLVLINPQSGQCGLDDYTRDYWLQANSITVINPYSENHDPNNANDAGFKFSSGRQTVINPRLVNFPSDSDTVEFEGINVNTFIVGGDFGGVSSVSTASYIVWKSGSTYYMTNGMTGQREWSSTSADSIFGAVIGNLSSGGLIHVKSGIFSLGSSGIMFEGGERDTREWIFQGEGITTDIKQTNAGKDAITIQNSSRVTIRDLKVSMSSGTRYGIYLSPNGADELSLRRGGISNVHIAGGAEILLNIVNPMDCYFERIRIDTTDSGTIPLVIANNSTSTHYGNSQYDMISIYGYQTGKPLMLINKTAGNKNVNLNTFTNIQIAGDGTETNMIGLRIDRNVNYNKFDWLTIEGVETAVYINGVSGEDSSANVFYGGYWEGSSKALWTGYYTIANTFKGITLATEGSTVLDEDQDYRIPNVYEDLYWASSKTVSVAGSNPGPSFRGSAGNGEFFEQYITFTSLSNGSYIEHDIIDTPEVVLVSLTNQGYAWVGTTNTTHVQLYFNVDTASGCVHMQYKDEGD